MTDVEDERYHRLMEATRELARKLSGEGVTANSFSPGFVATRFGDQSGGLYALGIRISKLFAQAPETGAETLVHLASSPEVEVSSDVRKAQGSAAAQPARATAVRPTD